MTKKAHLIGICGAGMSAVAYLLKLDGYEISGSDAGFYPPVSDYIAKLGFTCLEGYAVENIPSDVDLIVIGKNAKLVPESNEEVRLALDTYGDRVKSFPEVLGSLSQDKDRCVIAGSYGKSTLTSMVTWCLIHAGKHPSYFIGAIPKGFEHSSSLDNGPYFLFEGDEYPSANWDDRSKFEHYDPHTVILTSACHDHVNIFPTLEDYHKPFEALLDKLFSQNGTLVACVTEPNAKKLFDGYQGNKISYGLSSDSTWTAREIMPGQETSFDLVHNGETLGRVGTSQLGRHNVENIVGAAAWLLGTDVLSFQEFATAIKSYAGIARRLDLKSTKSALPIYEGFGSSYEKARAAIIAIKEHYAGRQLTVFFEPHTFSWRNKARLDQYRTVFDDVDQVCLFKPASQGADTHDQLTLGEILAETSTYHQNVKEFSTTNYQAIIDGLSSTDDVVLILSSGAFDGLLPKLIEQAEISFAA